MPRFWVTLYKVVGKDGLPVDLRFVDRSVPLRVVDVQIVDEARQTTCTITLEFQGVQTTEDIDRGIRA